MRLFYVFTILLAPCLVICSAAAAATPPRIGHFKKKVQRQEQLCPFEYQSCYCDYTNVNNEAGAAAAQESLSSRLQMPASASHLASAKSSAAFASSLSFSIMIDCQHFNGEAAHINNQKAPKSSNKTAGGGVLKVIPRIQTSSSNPAQHSNKFKYLSHVTHLDLSRTAITEVPTDAFFVSLQLYSLTRWQ
jgi:hypothetical protein